MCVLIWTRIKRELSQNLYKQALFGFLLSYENIYTFKSIAIYKRIDGEFSKNVNKRPIILIRHVWRDICDMSLNNRIILSNDQSNHNKITCAFDKIYYITLSEMVSYVKKDLFTLIWSHTERVLAQNRHTQAEYLVRDQCMKHSYAISIKFHEQRHG